MPRCALPWLVCILVLAKLVVTLPQNYWGYCPVHLSVVSAIKTTDETFVRRQDAGTIKLTSRHAMRILIEIPDVTCRQRISKKVKL